MSDRSEKKERIYTFVGQFIDDHGYPPTIIEIREALGISSNSVVLYNLLLLARDGRIRWQEGKARTLSVVPPTTLRDPATVEEPTTLASTEQAMAAARAMPVYGKR